MLTPNNQILLNFFVYVIPKRKFELKLISAKFPSASENITTYIMDKLYYIALSPPWYNYILLYSIKWNKSINALDVPYEYLIDFNFISFRGAQHSISRRQRYGNHCIIQLKKMRLINSTVCCMCNEMKPLSSSLFWSFNRTDKFCASFIEWWSYLYCKWNIWYCHGKN